MHRTVPHNDAGGGDGPEPVRKNPRGVASPQHDQGPRIAFTVVIPVFNSIGCLQLCLDSVIAAASHHGGVEIIAVDNGSSDGSYELLKREYGQRVQVHRLPSLSIAAVRNRGAAMAAGDYVSFLDSDCVIPEDYFTCAESVFTTVGADATGSRVVIPASPHWIESVWEAVHAPSRDGPVRYLNSGNFVVRRSIFDRLGGFDEALVTGEDAELGQRMTAAGLAIYQARRVRAVHLRNPKSLHAFYSKEVWHALGMFSTWSWSSLDKPIVITFGHGVLHGLGLLLLLNGSVPILARIAGFVLASFTAPVATVVYRGVQHRRMRYPLRAVFLYHVYLDARLWAMVLLAVRRLRHGTQHGP